MVIVFNIDFTKEKKDDEFYNDPAKIDTIPPEELKKARDSFKQYSYNDTEDSSKFFVL